jgi:hypothetical protein
MRRYSPGTFALSTNCSRFAIDTARMIGINVPSNLTTFGITNPSKVAIWSANQPRHLNSGLIPRL